VKSDTTLSPSTRALPQPGPRINTSWLRSGAVETKRELYAGGRELDWQRRARLGWDEIRYPPEEACAGPTCRAHRRIVTGRAHIGTQGAPTSPPSRYRLRVLLTPRRERVQILPSHCP